jgi:transposase
MFIERIKPAKNAKSKPQILLRETYREPGAPRSQVKHRTLLNLTHCDPKGIAAIEFALKHKNNLDEIRKLAAGRVKTKQGLSVGAVWTLWRVAQDCGIAKSLGDSREARLALWLVFARLIMQGSRLGAARLARNHAACEILGLGDFDEDDLYKSLDWLDSRQTKIENYLFKRKYSENAPQLFLYDVTSSYLEGEQNAYGAYGYNRDGKRGKLQIVVGLLADEEGEPMSVEVFDGNTQDTKTVYSQIRKMADRFGARKVTLVGDRGMIKSAQINLLGEELLYFLSALTKPQIDSMVKRGVLQYGMFDEELCEIEESGVRYILRRNPVRARETAMSREDKYRCATRFAENKNAYLAEHSRASVEVAAREVEQYVKKLRIDGWAITTTECSAIIVRKDEDKLIWESRLDGCYALRSDMPHENANAEQLHARYKDLTLVEKAFRTIKTGHLEIRPVYVRSAAHTRSHVFTVMLAYLIRRKLDAAWRPFDLTVEEGIEQLATLCANEVTIADVGGYLEVPAPRDDIGKLFDALNIIPPTNLPRRAAVVATKKKLQNRRKSK